jgi:hypothetical protein
MIFSELMYMKTLFLGLVFLLAGFYAWNKYGDQIKARIHVAPSPNSTPMPTEIPPMTQAPTPTPNPTLTITPAQTPAPTPQPISTPPVTWVAPTQFNGTHCDFTTTDGEVTKNATIKRVEPDGVVITYTDGVKKIHFFDLPAEVAQKYGYDPIVSSQFRRNQQSSEITAQANAVSLAQGVMAAKSIAASVPAQVQAPQSQPNLPKTFQTPKVQVKQVFNGIGYVTPEETLTIISKENDGLMVMGESQNTYKVHLDKLPDNIRKAYYGY